MEIQYTHFPAVLGIEHPHTCESSTLPLSHIPSSYFPKSTSLCTLTFTLKFCMFLLVLSSICLWEISEEGVMLKQRTIPLNSSVKLHNDSILLTFCWLCSPCLPFNKCKFSVQNLQWQYHWMLFRQSKSYR